jgi:hypothetical protein
MASGGFVGATVRVHVSGLRLTLAAPHTSDHRLRLVVHIPSCTRHQTDRVTVQHHENNVVSMLAWKGVCAAGCVGVLVGWLGGGGWGGGSCSLASDIRTDRGAAH